MIRKAVVYFVAVTLAALLILLGLIVVRFRPIDPHSPGGIARLQVLAQTSRPLMTAIEQYHKDHGYYPAQFSDLGPAYDPVHNMGWYYEGWTTREEAQQYSLSILPGPGHDPLLIFSHHADGTSQWVYDPGDSSPETSLPFTIKAEPASAKLPNIRLHGIVQTTP